MSTTEAPLEDKLRYAFNVYDIDRNSSIDRAEIVFILRAMFELLGMTDDQWHQYSYNQCVDTIMQSLDVNHDQRLSKEEFIQGLKKDAFLQSLMNPFQHVWLASIPTDRDVYFVSHTHTYSWSSSCLVVRSFVRLIWQTSHLLVALFFLDFFLFFSPIKWEQQERTISSDLIEIENHKQATHITEDV